MKKVLVLVLILMVLGLWTCDSPTESKHNPYEQHPIPWPSLADSPWPMYRHDPQNTGRSECHGALSGILVNKITQRNSQTTVVTGPDLTLYYFDQEPEKGYLLCAGDINGNIKWSKRVLRNDEPSTAPVVLYDGSIVAIGLEKGEYIRLAADGDTMWQCYSGNFSGLWASNAGITVGLDTTIYFVDNTQTLRAISKDGTLEWSLSDSRFSSDCEYIPAFSPDGKTLYANGYHSTTLLAIDLVSHSIKWTFGNSPLGNSPLVDNQGNIFLLNGEWQWGETSDRAFYSLNPQGEVRWRYALNDVDTYRIEPVIDWQGNVYFATDTLYSFTNDGELRWKIVLGHNLHAPLVCDRNNNIYFVTNDNDGLMLTVFSINCDGKINWSIENTGEHIRLGSTPIIFNSYLIVPGWRSEWMYVIQ